MKTHKYEVSVCPGSSCLFDVCVDAVALRGGGGQADTRPPGGKRVIFGGVVASCLGWLGYLLGSISFLGGFESVVQIVSKQ